MSLYYKLSYMRRSILLKLLSTGLILLLNLQPALTFSDAGYADIKIQGLFSKKTGKTKGVKLNKPMSAKQAMKKQEANDRKLKKEYEDFVKENQKRSFEIQTPEVQARMKQNQKDAKTRYKAKNKNNSTATRKAARKYK